MKLFFVIAFSFFILSCGRNSTDQTVDSGIKTKVIQLISNPDSILSNISDIALDIQYIPLQKTVYSRIEVIDKVVASENKIYISLVNNLLCFDNEGQYLYKLSGNGKVNGESFDAIYDFDISSVDSSLIVLSSNKIFHYKNTGTEFIFIKSINLGQPSPSKLAIVPGTENILLSFIRVFGSEPSLNVLINKNGDTISFKPNYYKKLNAIRSGFSNEIIQYRCENSVCFKEKFNDTVFSVNIESNTFSPRFVIDSRLSSTTSKNINDLEYRKILPQVINILEVHRYLYYSYNFVQRDHKVLYDKYEDRRYEINPINGVLKDDISGGPDFDLYQLSEDKFYSWISARELKRYIKSEGFVKAQVQNPLKKEFIKSLADSLNDTDNHVLIVLTLKN
jgi:hypothetical protein